MINDDYGYENKNNNDNNSGIIDKRTRGVGFDMNNEADVDPSHDKKTIACETFQFPSAVHPGIGVFVVTSCSSRYKDTKLESDCRYPGPLAFVPVDVEGIVYRNVFCALCNDVKSGAIRPWKVWLTQHTESNERQRCQQLFANAIQEILDDNDDQISNDNVTRSSNDNESEKESKLKRNIYIIKSLQ